MKDKLIRVDKNGTEYYANYTCPRCGGAGGSDKWQFTGWTCYECGGSGISARPQIYKKYTPEYEAKLNERRAKRAAKRLAEAEAKAAETRAKWLADNQFNENGETYIVLGDTYAIKDDLKALGAKYNSLLGWHISHAISGYDTAIVNIKDVATETLYGYTLDYTKDIKQLIQPEEVEEVKASDHYGNAGDKIEMTLTLNHIAWFENSFRPWEHNTTYIYNMTDDNGNVFVWKTSKGMDIAKGTKVSVKGTIKEHNEYAGVKQTVLTRCSIKGDA